MLFMYESILIKLYKMLNVVVRNINLHQKCTEHADFLGRGHRQVPGPITPNFEEVPSTRNSYHSANHQSRSPVIIYVHYYVIRSSFTSDITRLNCNLRPILNELVIVYSQYYAVRSPFTADNMILLRILQGLIVNHTF